ncbi:hypothetical protein K1T71_004961 [Dendrolimus kikuchii]|uniref:Uncharacterized protein n=1 Tax=Dendrolimus kikuchii TaxID=765133 RepID=A0ACC1D5R3_9NEOP|nr:hypothetical protein K1T71_004961 [Dendrolimus kikuchii]
MSTLSKKINEFNTENDMMKSSLEVVKADFFKDLNEIIEFLRKSVTETIALQLQTEELNCALSDLNSQNADLRKQINHSDHLKCQTTKGRIEELEKELKEERCKKIVMKDRLTKAEGQMKIGKERTAQLEAALEQARSQTWSLERTIQQLHEQNKKLQDDFDREFSKLTESIKEHTVQLEEIADAREKLQSEKEDLEKQLGELSDYYNESLKNVKHEMNINVAKLIETESKYGEEIEDKKRLEIKVESLCAQLLETQLRLKDITKELEDKDLQLKNTEQFQKELESTKTQLEAAKTTIEEYENRLTRQTEAIEQIEETINLKETLRNNMSNKDKYIIELEKKQSLLEQQLQESECKMESYEEQLSSLKTQISQLLEDFGEFENLNDLHGMINKQRAKLLETTRHNGELAEALQRKDLEIEQHLENLAEQESTLEQREGIIRMLTEKEEEQTNIIKLLRNNLEIRAQADSDLNQQILEKNVEIDSLLTNLETRKQTISQLERIILTLEDQTRKASQQIRKDQEKIRSLEEKLIEYENIKLEYKRSVEIPSSNLDNFIKILEDELGTCVDRQNTSEHEYIVPKQRYAGDHKRGKAEIFEYDTVVKNENQYRRNREYDNLLTKVLLGKTSKKMRVPYEEQFKGDNLDRKRGIINIDSHNVNSVPEPDINMYTSVPPVLDNLPMKTKRKATIGPQKERNLPFIIPQQLRDDKQFKMFKFAGHRL